jgi:hypothetical protein
MLWCCCVSCYWEFQYLRKKVILKICLEIVGMYENFQNFFVILLGTQKCFFETVFFQIFKCIRWFWSVSQNQATWHRQAVVEFSVGGGLQKIRWIFWENNLPHLRQSKRVGAMLIFRFFVFTVLQHKQSMSMPSASTYVCLHTADQSSICIVICRQFYSPTSVLICQSCNLLEATALYITVQWCIIRRACAWTRPNLTSASYNATSSLVRFKNKNISSSSLK